MKIQFHHHIIMLMFHPCQVGTWSDSLEEKMLMKMKQEIEDDVINDARHQAAGGDGRGSPADGGNREKTNFQDNLDESFDTSWSTYKNPPPMQPQVGGGLPLFTKVILKKHC